MASASLPSSNHGWKVAFHFEPRLEARSLGPGSSVGQARCERRKDARGGERRPAARASKQSAPNGSAVFLLERPVRFLFSPRSYRENRKTDAMKGALKRNTQMGMSQKKKDLPSVGVPLVSLFDQPRQGGTEPKTRSQI